MSALTFSDGAQGREVQRRQHSGHTREMQEQSWLPAKRSNDLVTAIFKIVELRGLEPLTFSLRRHRVDLPRREYRVIAVRFVAAGVRWLQSRGTHGAHDRGLSFATATDTKACIWRHPRTCRYPILRLRARGSRVVAKIATKKDMSKYLETRAAQHFGAEGPHRDREQQRRVDASREGHSQPRDRSRLAETAVTARSTLQCSL
jgi:hypothetical protein